MCVEAFVAVEGDSRKYGVAAALGAPQLQLREEGDGARRTLLLAGELDMAWASVLHEALHRICTEDTEAIVLDLSKLTFMDSTGLRAVLLAEELCEKHRCGLVLVPGPPQVQRLFEVTGLLDRLPFETPAGGV